MMRSAIITVIAALAALIPVARDVAAAQTRMQPLVRAGDTAPWCLADQTLCMSVDSISGNPQGARSSVNGSPVLSITRPWDGEPNRLTADLPLPLTLDQNSWVDVWPMVIPMPSNNGAADEPFTPMMIGVLLNTSVGYSGGGGTGSRLLLYRLDRGAGSTRIGPEILNVPWAMSVIIRSCFSETDYAQNAGTCHDEYRSSADIALRRPQTTRRRPAAVNAEPAMPDLVYQTVAEAFPSFARRDRDSSGQRRITATERTFARDRQCSYRRIIVFNPATGRYEFDRPSPECASYTLP